MTDAELAAAYTLPWQVWQDASPERTSPSLAEIVAFTRNLPASRTVLEWTVEGGFAGISWQHDDPDCYLNLTVAAAARRRGVGSRLLDHAADQARAAGRRILIGHFEDESGARFAARAGARIGNTDLTSVLTLPVAADRRPVPGYTLRSWQGAAPQELLAAWALARNTVNDAPHTEGASGWVFTPESVRDQERTAMAAGLQPRVVVALTAAGEVAACTEVQVGAGPGAIARTNDTSVGAAHRRRGLARWIKAQSLAGLMADRPDVTKVETRNDAANTAILAVNRSVGFSTVARSTEAVIDL